MLSAHGSAPEVVASARSRAGWWSTRCARWSPRSTTSSRCGPARGTPSSTSATTATRRRSGPWRWPRRRCACSSGSRTSTASTTSDADRGAAPGGPAGPDHPEPRRVGRHRRPGPPAVPRPVDAQPQRPVLRHHQPPGRAEGPGRPADAVVVIGSENSSNTVALEKVAVAFGCPRVLRVNDAAELPDDLSGTVGVTAGASAPEALVQAVVDRLAPVHGVHRAPVTVEEEYFPPPPELRELLRGLESGVGPAQRGTGRRPRRCVPTTPTGRCGTVGRGPGRRPDHGGGRRAGAAGRLSHPTRSADSARECGYDDFIHQHGRLDR